MDKKEFDRVWAEAFSDTFGTAFRWHETVYEFREELYTALYPTEEKEDVPRLPNCFYDESTNAAPYTTRKGAEVANIKFTIDRIIRYLQAKEGK